VFWDPLARVFDAWGFERCLWGTDWTRAFAVVNYEQAVAPFLETRRLSEAERAMLMGGACAKAHGWSPNKGSTLGPRSRHSVLIGPQFATDQVQVTFFIDLARWSGLPAARAGWAVAEPAFEKRRGAGRAPFVEAGSGPA